MTDLIGVIDPLMSSSLMNGMFWMLPLLASTCMAYREGMKRGYWEKEKRIGMKVMEACARFKMLAEAMKVQIAIVDYCLGVMPPSYPTFPKRWLASVKRISKRFKETKIKRAWTSELEKGFLLFNGGGAFQYLAFYFAKLGCILVTCGLDNIWVFKMMEAQLDAALAKCTSGILIGGDINNTVLKRRLTFKMVLDEILADPQFSTRFLRTFDVICSCNAATLELVPCYRHFLMVFGNYDSVVVSRMNRMPKCVLGCIAFLKAFAVIYTYPKIGCSDSIRFKVRHFETYLNCQNEGSSGKWKFVPGNESFVYCDEE